MTLVSGTKIKKDTDHLISELKAKYEVTQDCTGVIYWRIILKWDYKSIQLEISIPDYVKVALHKFQCSTPTRPQHSPHQWTAPQYGSTAPQMAHPIEESPEINPYELDTVQQVVETFLYYAHVVDSAILVALNTIAAKQSKIIQETDKKVVHLLDYAATHPEAITRYHASGMTLHMHSNASFLLAPGSKSRLGGYHYLSEPLSDPKKPPTTPPNGPIHL